MAAVVHLICPTCKEPFTKFRKFLRKTRNFCSPHCYHVANTGAGANNWAGGRWFEKSKGYWVISVGKGKRVFEHRQIAERAIGRPLKAHETVHHINGDKTDNRNTNLLVCTKKYHTELHQRMSMAYAATLET